MRVIAGKAKSIRLKTAEGLGTRPTTDRIKETLFNMLQPYLCDCRFLDLFSGSGGIGIEALSRGADKAVFVEKDRKALSCIRQNLEATHFEKEGYVVSGDFEKVLHQLEGQAPFDIVFMDPPYDLGYERKVLEYLADSGIVHGDTLFIVEASVTTDFEYLESYGYEILKRKQYKSNVHMFIKQSKER